jgi:L-asparagine oxygenase
MNATPFSAQDKPEQIVTEVAIGQTDRTRLSELTRHFASLPDIDDWEYILQARHATWFLPSPIKESLNGLRNRGGGLLFRGLDNRGIPPTPPSPVGAPTRETLMAAQTAVLLAYLAHPVAYRAEGSGRVVQSILPTRADQWKQTSTGSGNPLDIHTEGAFNFTSRPNYFALGCLRGDPNATTHLLTVRELNRLLPPVVLARLREEMFYTKVDESFVRGGASNSDRGPIAVIAGTERAPVLTYDADMMSSPSPHHSEALHHIRAVWEKHHAAVTLQPGDALLIHNDTSIHGRSAFHPQWDGGDRWLARVQGVVDPAVISRLCEPRSLIVESEHC